MGTTLYAAHANVPPLFIALFAILFVITMACVTLEACLFNRLRNDHPSTYEKLGRPSIFVRRANTWLFLKFLLRREWRDLGDRNVDELAAPLRALFFCHLALFVPLMIWMLILCRS
jgi:hypothetical protein